MLYNEGRYCSVEHLAVAEHYEIILDFYFTNQVPDWTYMYTDLLNLKKLYVKQFGEFMSNPRILISLPSETRQGGVLEPFPHGYYQNPSLEIGMSDLAPAHERLEQLQKLNALYLSLKILTIVVMVKCDSLSLLLPMQPCVRSLPDEGRFSCLCYL